MFFSDDYSEKTPEALAEILAGCVKRANIPSMVVTMGGKGAVYADREGTYGICPAKKVQVKDTTGAGDAFCAGVASGLTYGKGSGGDWNTSGGVRDHVIRECLSAFPSGGTWN